MAKTIVITGANGNVSAGVIAALANSGHKVRALVRNADKAKSLKGVEIVVGDLEKPKTLAAAFDGVDSTFILTPPGPRAPEQSSNALWAARKAGVKHVVRMSAVGAAHDAPTINSRLHALSDAELAGSGIKHTIVKPHFFFQNMMMAAQSVASESTIYMALGEGRMGIVDTRDISEVVAKILTTPGHDNKTYTLTGPRSITLHDVAAALTNAVGKPVKYVPVPVEGALAAMAQMGLDEWMLNMMSDYFTAYSANWGDFMTNDVEKLLGKPARSADDFARDFAGAFGKR
jgi:uncharacterized protein YbjT (DUF2867 family)